MKTYDFAPFGSHCLVLDWLAINVPDIFRNKFHDVESFMVGSFCVTAVDRVTLHFNKFATIHDNLGDLVATVTFDSRKDLILKDRAIIKFENHLFYQDFSLFFSSFCLAFAFDSYNSKFSRVDIALDGVNLNSFVYDYCTSEDFSNNFFRVRDIDNFKFNNVSVSSIRANCFDSFTVGSLGSRENNTKRSNKIIRYYNKTKELSQRNKKAYISEWHEMNGLVGSDVYRFEISFNSSFLSQFNTDFFDLFRWRLHETMIVLFKHGCSQLFEFRIKDNDNVSRCSSLDIFKLETVPQKLTKVKKLPSKIRTIKVLIKRTVSDLLLNVHRFDSDVSIHLYNIVVLNLKTYNLYEWFYERFSSWLVDINKESIIKGIELNPRFLNPQQYA
jgi:hypothetical protein